MRIIKIKDTSIRHCLYSNNPLPPTSFCEHIQWNWDWDISKTDKDELIVYTHTNIMDGINDNRTNKVCWLIEPYDFVKHDYDTIINHNEKFKYVFTHEKELLKLGENYKFIPFGGCWIKEEDRKIHDKNKMVSIISSGKNQLEGHKLRHKVISENKDKITVLGNGYKAIDEKITGLKEYRFSIAIENAKRDYYFTEKLIDCLITGTVPIYWGCPSIGDFFNPKGFIICNNLSDFTNAINSLTEQKYEDMRPYIEENFERAKNFILSEYHIYDNFIEKGLI